MTLLEAVADGTGLPGSAVVYTAGYLRRNGCCAPESKPLHPIARTHRTPPVLARPGAVEFTEKLCTFSVDKVVCNEGPQFSDGLYKSGRVILNIFYTDRHFFKKQRAALILPGLL
jgi:hypothetical protein